MKSFVFHLCLSVVLSASAQTVRLVNVSTNMPAFDFSAATPLGAFPRAAYWHNRSNSWTATIEIEAPAGEYDVQWNYALGLPRTNMVAGKTSYEGHAFVNVWPPIVASNATMQVQFPCPPSQAGFWRLKRR